LGAICPPDYVPNGQAPCEGIGSDIRNLMYDKPNDTMYISGFTPNYLGSNDVRYLGNKLWKFTNWLKPNRAVEWTVDLPFDLNASPNLRVGSMDMSGDYIIGVEERSPNGEYLISKATGEIKYMSSQVLGDFGLGWVDINHGGILLNKRPDGTYLSSSEDDHYTKSFTNYIKPNSYNSIVTGQLYFDGNGNNAFDSNESGESLPIGTKIKLTSATDSNLVFYPIVNTYGDYAQTLPAGTYNIEYIVPSGYAVDGLSPNSVTTTTNTVNNTDSAPVGISVASTGGFTALTSSDIPGINFTCNTSNFNSNTSCNFTLPANKTLPTDFKISIGNTSSFGTQVCSQSGNQATCSNIPAPNSVGNLSIFATIGGVKTDTGETVKIIGASLGSATWSYTPDQGSLSPLFKSSDTVNIKITNFKSVYDQNPASSSYVCTLEYRNLADQNSSATTWNQLTSNPVSYDPITGCGFNVTKTQRGNTLNQSLRLKITKTNGGILSTNSEDISTFYSEYLYRFQGAGLAVGN
jgi:hypothetical protein